VLSGGVASARTIYVPDDYAKIQWAVDNASDGDTIIVRDGIYYENVDVHKRLTIKSENRSANCIVQAANSDDHVFWIAADYVNISGFTIKGTDFSGVFIYYSNNVVVENNLIFENGRGITLFYSDYNLLSNNTISNCYTDIYMREGADYNRIENNILKNASDGIDFDWWCNHNTIVFNTIAFNDFRGIDLSTSCKYNLIYMNISSTTP